MVHILGIVATFVFQDSQIITFCVAFTIPYALYRAMNQPVNISRLLVAVIFVGSAVALLVKTIPSGGGPATMLMAMSLIILADPAAEGRRPKVATVALLFLAGYAAFALLFRNASVDTIFLHSKNYLSVLGLIFYFAAQSEWETSGKQAPHWLSIPAIGLCLLSLSVGGLLGAAGIVLFLLARRFGTPRLAAAVLGLAVVIFTLTSLLPIGDYFRKLSALIPQQGSWGVLFMGLTSRLSALFAGEGGGDRLTIWSAYLDQLGPMSWWTGLPLHELLKQSLHNSYLTLHMNFGVLAMVLVAAWMIVITRAHLSPLMLFLLGVLALRAFVDSILFFGGYFDGLLLLTLRLYEQPQVWVPEPSRRSQPAGGMQAERLT